MSDTTKTSGVIANCGECGGQTIRLQSGEIIRTSCRCLDPKKEKFLQTETVECEICLHEMDRDSQGRIVYSECRCLRNEKGLFGNKDDKSGLSGELAYIQSQNREMLLLLRDILENRTPAPAPVANRPPERAMATSRVLSRMVNDLQKIPVPASSERRVELPSLPAPPPSPPSRTAPDALAKAASKLVISNSLGRDTVQVQTRAQHPLASTDGGDDEDEGEDDIAEFPEAALSRLHASPATAPEPVRQVKRPPPLPLPMLLSRHGYERSEVTCEFADVCPAIANSLRKDGVLRQKCRDQSKPCDIRNEFISGGDDGQ